MTDIRTQDKNIIIPILVERLLTPTDYSLLLQLTQDLVQIEVNNDSVVDSMLQEASKITSYPLFVSAMKEVLIRFNTDPKKYSKPDYFKLLLLLLQSFRYLYNLDISEWIIDDWEDAETSKIPSSVLVKNTVERLDNKLKWIRITDEDGDE